MSRWMTVALAGMCQGLGDLKREADRVFERERTVVLHQIANVHPFDEFEDDVVHAPIFADVVDPRDVFVIEPGGRLGFVAKAAERFFVGRLVARQHLDGDFPIEGRVEGAKDHAHAAAADELLEQELPELLAFQQAAGIERRPERPSDKPRSRLAGGNDVCSFGPNRRTTASNRCRSSHAGAGRGRSRHRSGTDL